MVKGIRKVWVDGCYDLFHYGHANGLRQADCLDPDNSVVAGIHSNESIKHNKGIPVMEDDERLEMVRSCRWVSEVIESVPFSTDMDIVRRHGCVAVMHANDPISDANGHDCYQEAKSQNAYEEFERTLGISTTDILDRILHRKKNVEKMITNNFEKYQESLVSIFLDSIGKKNRNNTVFIDGIFDIFHAGHVFILKQARMRGDYVIVGLYSDEDAKNMSGEYPILSFLERKLVLLSCKYVDEVVRAPHTITSDFLMGLDVKCVVYGSNRNPAIYKEFEQLVEIVKIDKNRFSYLTGNLIIHRVISNYEKYRERNIKKMGSSL